MPRFAVGDEVETRGAKVQVEPPFPANGVMEFEVVVEDELGARSEPDRMEVRSRPG